MMGSHYRCTYRCIGDTLFLDYDKRILPRREVEPDGVSCSRLVRINQDYYFQGELVAEEALESPGPYGYKMKGISENR